MESENLCGYFHRIYIIFAGSTVLQKDRTGTPFYYADRLQCNADSLFPSVFHGNASYDYADGENNLVDDSNL